MNRRHINNVLKNKHKKLVASITDPVVRKLVENNSIVTGGSIASMLLGEPIKDFDYYFTDRETVIAVANYYVNQFNYLHPEIDRKPHVVVTDDGRVKVKVQSAGIVSENGDTGYAYFEQHPDEAGMDYVDRVTATGQSTEEMAVAVVEEGDEHPAEILEQLDGSSEAYRPVFMSANAITLSDKVQLVLRFYGDPAEIHKNYDFAHCCNWWTSKEQAVVLTPNAMESLLSKHLIYQGSLYPLCSVIRTRKFLKRGWHINAGQYLKMCFQISELDLSDLDTLEEQLTGVDAAYFHQIIAYCRKRAGEDSEFKVTAPYLVSVIDKIFG